MKHVCSAILLTCFFLTGCFCGKKADTQISTASKSDAETVKATVPAASDKCVTKKSTVKKEETQPAPSEPEKIVKKEKPIVKQVAVSPDAKVSAPKPAAKPPQKHTPPPRKRHGKRPPEKFLNGVGLWRAFSRLDQKEQHELLQLQRQNPEQFRKIMQEKVAALYAKERVRRAELEQLAAKYKKSNNDAEKSRIKAELKQKIQDDFNQRLQDSRRDLESNRKRLRHMEKELSKREKNREAIIEAMLNKRLSD